MTTTCPQCGTPKDYRAKGCRYCYNQARVKASQDRRDQPRTCPSCGVMKDASEFRAMPGKAGARYSSCRPCANQQLRWYHILRKYGVTAEQYAAMLDKQGDVCAICHGPPNNTKGGVLYVDHDHATGKVRGLLCHTCNTGLGHFRDQPDLLRSAITYLEGRLT